MALRLILLSAVCMGCIGIVAAQDSVKRWQDSLRLSVGTVSTAASKDFLPFWLVANRYGTIKDRKNDVSTNIYLYNEHTIGKSSLRFNYTVDLYNNNHFNDFTLVEANIKVDYKGWQLRAGRYREVIGEVDSSLSTGSLGISGNALPIPKISIAVPEYKPFPWTNGWIQFKGLFSHGWMGSERFLSSYLHEKALYIRAGRGNFRLFGGIAHFAEWGGKRNGYQLERGLSAFWNVFSLREANDGSVPHGSNKRPNRAGDHRGIMDLGVDLETSNGYWHFYHQTPFESGTGIDIRNVDRLAGISFCLKDPSTFFRKFTVEFIHTKQMESFAREKQSYYNNGAYRTGWEYQYLIVGTPLFLNRYRASKFLPIPVVDWRENADIAPNSNVVSNRLVGVHLATEYMIRQKWHFKTMLTYNAHDMERSSFRNYLNNVYHQMYTLQEVTYAVSQRVQLKAAVACDFGDFYNNVGGYGSLRYNIKLN